MATFVWLHDVRNPNEVVKRLVNMDHVVKTERVKGPPAYTQLYLRDGPALHVFEDEATIAELLAVYGVTPPERSA